MVTRTFATHFIRFNGLNVFPPFINTNFIFHEERGSRKQGLKRPRYAMAAPHCVRLSSLVLAWQSHASELSLSPQVFVFSPGSPMHQTSLCCHKILSLALAVPCIKPVLVAKRVHLSFGLDSLMHQTCPCCQMSSSLALAVSWIRRLNAYSVAVF